MKQLSKTIKYFPCLPKWHHRKSFKNYKRISFLFSVYTQDLTKTKEILNKDILKETLHVTKKFMRNTSEKKQILICQEQSDADKNKNFLKICNTKCILRWKPNLWDFSKDIKLSYLTTSPINFLNNDTSHNLSSSNYIHNKAKYILQTIKIDDNGWMLFYENECRTCSASVLLYSI